MGAMFCRWGLCALLHIPNWQNDKPQVCVSSVELLLHFPLTERTAWWEKASRLQSVLLYVFFSSQLMLFLSWGLLHFIFTCWQSFPNSAVQHLADDRFLTHQGSFLMNISVALSRFSESCSVVNEQDRISSGCCTDAQVWLLCGDTEIRMYLWDAFLNINTWLLSTIFFIVLSRKHFLLLAEEVPLPCAIFIH